MPQSPQEKFLNFLILAAAVAGGVWIFYRADELRTRMVTNTKEGRWSRWRGEPRRRVRHMSTRTARRVGDQIGIEWDNVAFSVTDLARGMLVEMEHGRVNEQTNVTDDDLLLTGKIAWAHLNEFPDYYTRLDALEEEASQHWGPRAS